jgi:zinc transport system permease protein
MQLALLGGVIIGASAPLLGCFIAQRRMSLIGDGIGHVAVAGVAGGLLLAISPVWTAPPDRVPVDGRPHASARRGRLVA